MKLFLLFFMLPFALHGSQEKTRLPQASKEPVIDKRENYFQTSTSYKISSHVNPITGDLIEEEVDLIVAGIEPISVRRFYTHTGMYEPRYGGWRYNPEIYLVANFEWQEQERFAAAGEMDGSIHSFQASSSYAYSYTFDISKGFVNFKLNGQSHPLNTKIVYGKIGDKKNKKRFFWKGEVTDGSGRKRFFASNMHSWLEDILITKTRRVILDEKAYYWATPNVWTPYQLPIQEARLPNGNILHYSYVHWKKNKKWPTPPLINTITAYNSDKTKILGSILFNYTRDKHEDVTGITVVGSDGRKASMHHQGKETIRLQSVQTPDQPIIAYGHRGQSIIHVQKPDSRLTVTEYNTSGKVAAQYAPIGPNGEMHSIHKYEYLSQASIVYDAEGHKTIYRYDEHNKIHSIETYQGENLYRTDRFIWEASTGNMLQKRVEDGLGQVIQAVEYQYDKNHNPIFEKTGCSDEWRIIKRTFSDDGFNLKLTENDQDDKIVRYSYLPNTNLLIAELTYEKDTIRKRIFYSYDECAVCVKTICDDGTTENANDLSGVTYRKITEIIPKQTTPCFGLPEVSVEKTIDASGNEILLEKVFYTYAPSGKILKEEHYDANDQYRFGILNNYDERERLQSTTDPLGHQTFFTYDANNNLLSIAGPKPGQFKEISYDKVNRPVRIADAQMNGDMLITKKQYDKLGQLIEEIDVCGNSTRFTYDSLGRVIATIYSDGAIVKKEYDIQGNVTKEIDPEGYITHTLYNAFNQPLSIQYPDGTQEFFTYNRTGTLNSHTDKNGATTLFAYDIFNHLIKTETYSNDQLLKATSAVWTAFNKISETDAENTTTFFTYDYAGRKIGEQKGYQTLHYTYCPLGKLESIQEEETKIVYEYDVVGQMTAKTVQNGNDIQTQEKYIYDEAGNITHKINSQGATETIFNTQGKPIEIKDILGFTTHFAYSYPEAVTEISINPNGIQTLVLHNSRGWVKESHKKNTQGESIQKRTSSYDKKGNRRELNLFVFCGITPLKTITHNWEYGPMARIERFIEASEKETGYLYDKKGRLKTIIKPNSCRIEHEYDDLGRLARYFAHDFDYRYHYDKNDRVISVYDQISKATTRREYDPLGNVLNESLGNGLLFRNVYDTRGRRIQLILPDKSCVNYSYDGIYLYSVSRKGYTHTYAQRNQEGKVLQAILPGNLGEISIDRDGLGRYQKFSTPFYSAYYPKNAFDPVGNLLNYVYQDTLGKISNTYRYDGLNQLIQENEHSYLFDSLYNRTKKDDEECAVNSLCQISHPDYSYDLCGNLISDGEREYFYDSLDRLIAIEMDNKRIEYTYDAFHRRLSKKVSINNMFVNSTLYMWDGNHEIGAVVEGVVRELRILGEGLGAEIGSAVLYELQDKPYVPIHDHRGCVVVLTDLVSQQPVECYRYTAFGEELLNNALSPWRFASKRVDESGLVFFGRRYYQPELGRWITQDPLGFKDGPNLYAYLQNSPLMQVDCYGLFGEAFGRGFNRFSRRAFGGLEWMGANLIPIPYVQHTIESVGRWGAGGDFWGSSRYRTSANEVIPISGRTVPGLSYTHGNGMMTKREDAIKQAEYISKTHGNVQVDLLYHGTNGLMMDLIGCSLSKLGVPNSYNKMCASYYASKLKEDPNHTFTSSVHSRGGTQIMNTGRLLSPNQRKHIDVLSYGSATLIPDNYFRFARNILNPVDVVTMSNPLAFCVGLLSKQYNMNFLAPSSYCPFKAHGLLEDTYAEEIERRGDAFKEKYFYQ